MRRYSRFTASERDEIWKLWRQRSSIADIARTLGRGHGHVWTVVQDNGGFPTRTWKRNAAHLTTAEREEVSRGLSCNLSLRAIAAKLGRSPSTISREVSRNGGHRCYRATSADKRAATEAKRPKLCKLARSSQLRRVVATKLHARWSPEQIAGWLRVQHPCTTSMQVSHETIYRSLFIQARGVLKAELLDCLRSRQHKRLRRSGRPTIERRGKIPDAVSIRTRPASIEDRAVPGHWEGDLLVGTHGSYLATLVERASRFVLLVKVSSKDTTEVISALTKQALKLPQELRRSLTLDRGHEFADHKRFTLATDIAVYFCDPHSPWQRGTNENTNGLLRQYFPKSTGLSHYTQTELNRVSRELNERPRKTLGFRTPAEVYNLSLQ